jgi:4-amino-4-deoxy-L-arabinose transferase-like glycosyltransferase
MSTALEAPPPAPLDAAPQPVWKLNWLTPGLCRLILAALILLGAISHILYLNSPDALELSPDEAQYWVWSKQLDWSYYSKGPMIALLIRASTSMFGDTMAAVRYPAIAIGVGMMLMTYWLTRKLFGSDRLALGAVALSHFVPMFIAGSIIMTIDPPYVLFWTAATCFFFKAILDDAKWAWLLVGAMLGLSFLAKYFAPVQYVGILLGLAIDRKYRRHLASPMLYVGMLVFAAFTLPVLYWNQTHGWVSAHHVQADIDSGFNPIEPLQFVGGQVAIIGPFLCVILAAATWHAFRAARLRPSADAAQTEPARRARLLALTSLPVLLIVAIYSFLTNIQLNWTAPVWFALLIVGAWFLSTKMSSAATWKPWRGFLWGTVIFGLMIMPLAHHIRTLWPAFAWFQTNVLKKHVRVRGDGVQDAYASMSESDRKNVVSVRRYDPTCRLLGWTQLADYLDTCRDLRDSHGETVGKDAFLMTDDYSEASALAFYSPGHPKTYIMGTYIEDVRHRGWKDLGRGFERFEQLPVCEIYVRSHGTDYHIGGYRVWACYNFKGFERPKDGVNVW